MTRKYHSNIKKKKNNQTQYVDSTNKKLETEHEKTMAEIVGVPGMTERKRQINTLVRYPAYKNIKKLHLEELLI